MVGLRSDPGKVVLAYFANIDNMTGVFGFYNEYGRTELLHSVKDHIN